jgi:ABC-type glycerol-3-phosphate transport system substrate-binding protein
MDRKKFDRYLFTTALIVLGVFTVYGLLAQRAGPGGRKTLSFTSFLGESLDRETLVSLVREFEDRNPNIRIRLNREGGGETDENAGTGGPVFPSGIVVFDEGRINAFIRQGLLAALDPYLRPDQTDQSGPAPDQRALPLVSFMDLLFYNTGALQAAGIDRPPKTRAEFLACARAAAGGETAGSAGVFGAALAFSPGDPRGIRRDFFSWIWAAGLSLIREGRADFAAPPVTETLEFLRQLNAEGLLSPGTFDKTGAEKAEEFAAGRVAMMIGSVEDLPHIRARMGDSAFGVTLIPGPADYAGRPVIGPSQWYAGISAGCTSPDEAWAFLSFLAEKSPFLAAQVRAVPGSGGSPGGYVREDGFYSKAWDIYEAAELIQEFSGVPGGDELENIIREELALLFGGKKNAAETSAAIQKRWEDLSP